MNIREAYAGGNHSHFYVLGSPEDTWVLDTNQFLSLLNQRIREKNKTFSLNLLRGDVEKPIQLEVGFINLVGNLSAGSQLSKEQQQLQTQTHIRYDKNLTDIANERYHEIYQTEQILSLSEIFKKSVTIEKSLPRRRVLMTGRPGIGKSTLLQWVAYQLSDPAERLKYLGEEVVAVIHISLGDMYQWFETTAGLSANTLLATYLVEKFLTLEEADFINLKSNREIYNERLCSVQRYLNQIKPQTLFLLDGYDEIAQVDNNHPMKKLVAELIESTTYLVLATRPPYYYYHQFDQVIEVMGFSWKDAKNYIQHHFEPQTQFEIDYKSSGVASAVLLTKNILSGVGKNSKLRLLLRIPLLLQFFCIYMEKQKDKLNIIGMTQHEFSEKIDAICQYITVTQLYDVFFNNIKFDYLVGQAKTIAAEDASLSEIAFYQLSSQKLFHDISDKALKKIPNIDKLSQSLVQQGLLKCIDTGSKRVYCFVHHSFVEYFSGCYLATQIDKGSLLINSDNMDQYIRNPALAKALGFAMGILGLMNSEEALVKLDDWIIRLCDQITRIEPEAFKCLDNLPAACIVLLNGLEEIYSLERKPDGFDRAIQCIQEISLKLLNHSNRYISEAMINLLSGNQNVVSSLSGQFDVYCQEQATPGKLVTLGRLGYHSKQFIRKIIEYISSTKLPEQIAALEVLNYNSYFISERPDLIDKIRSYLFDAHISFEGDVIKRNELLLSFLVAYDNKDLRLLKWLLYRVECDAGDKIYSLSCLKKMRVNKRKQEKTVLLLINNITLGNHNIIFKILERIELTEKNIDDILETIGTSFSWPNIRSSNTNQKSKFDGVGFDDLNVYRKANWTRTVLSKLVKNYKYKYQQQIDTYLQGLLREGKEALVRDICLIDYEIFAFSKSPVTLKIILNRLNKLEGDELDNLLIFSRRFNLDEIEAFIPHYNRALQYWLASADEDNLTKIRPILCNLNHLLFSNVDGDNASNYEIEPLLNMCGDREDTRNEVILFKLSVGQGSSTEVNSYLHRLAASGNNVYILSYIKSISIDSSNLKSFALSIFKTENVFIIKNIFSSLKDKEKIKKLCEIYIEYLQSSEIEKINASNLEVLSCILLTSYNEFVCVIQVDISSFVDLLYKMTDKHNQMKLLSNYIKIIDIITKNEAHMFIDAFYREIAPKILGAMTTRELKTFVLLLSDTLPLSCRIVPDILEKTPHENGVLFSARSTFIHVPESEQEINYFIQQLIFSGNPNVEIVCSKILSGIKDGIAGFMPKLTIGFFNTGSSQFKAVSNTSLSSMFLAYQASDNDIYLPFIHYIIGCRSIEVDCKDNKIYFFESGKEKIAPLSINQFQRFTGNDKNRENAQRISNIFAEHGIMFFKGLHDAAIEWLVAKGILPSFSEDSENPSVYLTAAKNAILTWNLTSYQYAFSEEDLNSGLTILVIARIKQMLSNGEYNDATIADFIETSKLSPLYLNIINYERLNANVSSTAGNRPWKNSTIMDIHNQLVKIAHDVEDLIEYNKKTHLDSFAILPTDIDAHVARRIIVFEKLVSCCMKNPGFYDKAQDYLEILYNLHESHDKKSNVCCRIAILCWQNVTQAKSWFLRALSLNPRDVKILSQYALFTYQALNEVEATLELLWLIENTPDTIVPILYNAATQIFESCEYYDNYCHISSKTLSFYLQAQIFKDDELLYNDIVEYINQSTLEREHSKDDSLPPTSAYDCAEKNRQTLLSQCVKTCHESSRLCERSEKLSLLTINRNCFGNHSSGSQISIPEEHIELLAEGYTKKGLYDGAIIFYSELINLEIDSSKKIDINIKLLLLYNTTRNHDKVMSVFENLMRSDVPCSFEQKLMCLYYISHLCHEEVSVKSNCQDFLKNYKDELSFSENLYACVIAYHANNSNENHKTIFSHIQNFVISAYKGWQEIDYLKVSGTIMRHGILYPEDKPTVVDLMTKLNKIMEVYYPLSLILLKIKSHHATISDQNKMVVNAYSAWMGASGSTREKEMIFDLYINHPFGTDNTGVSIKQVCEMGTIPCNIENFSTFKKDLVLFINVLTKQVKLNIEQEICAHGNIPNQQSSTLKNNIAFYQVLAVLQKILNGNYSGQIVAYRNIEKFRGKNRQAEIEKILEEIVSVKKERVAQFAPNRTSDSRFLQNEPMIPLTVESTEEILSSVTHRTVSGLQ